MKQYMVIEIFHAGCRDKVYQRLRQKGRMIPRGLVYINSWLEKHGNRCFQLMETKDPALFEQWMNRWRDLINFEIVEVANNLEENGNP
jgi:hypothetical protein